VIPVFLCEPPFHGDRLGGSEVRHVIVDTGANAGLILSADDYDRFAWAQLKRATIRGAGTGLVRTGWGMISIGPDLSASARQMPICDGSERLRGLYDAIAARLGLSEGQVAGQAGMASLDSFPGWSSSGTADGRTFRIAF